MSTPDDSATPATDEVPDPVVATSPQADPAPDDTPDEDYPDGPPESPVLPIPGNRASTGFA